MAGLKLEARHVTNLGSFTRELGSCHSEMSHLVLLRAPVIVGETASQLHYLGPTVAGVLTPGTK